MNLKSIGARYGVILCILSITVLNPTHSYYIPPLLKRTTQLSVSTGINGLKGSQEIEDPSRLKDILQLQNKYGDSIFIILFYNPRCPHCKNFQPIFEETAINEDNIGSNKLFFKLDITKDSKIVKEYNIQFLPDVRVSKYLRSN